MRKKCLLNSEQNYVYVNNQDERNCIDCVRGLLRGTGGAALEEKRVNWKLYELVKNEMLNYASVRRGGEYWMTENVKGGLKKRGINTGGGVCE